MKKGWVGLESAGKSLLLVVEARDVFFYNKKVMNKRKKAGLPFFPRTMSFDTPISENFQKAIEETGMKYNYFRSFDEILWSEENDIFIHEITKWFPARGHEPLTPDQIEFLTQAAKVGVDIYFCCQDFSQVHKSFRYLVNELTQVTKLISSPRPRKSGMPVNFIWGIVLTWDLDPLTFIGETVTMEKISYWPSFYFINKEDCDLYDTRHRVRGANLPPIRMVEQEFIYLNSEQKEVDRKKKWVKR